MTVVFYILVIAVLNLSIGFAVAVYLGRRQAEMGIPSRGYPLGSPIGLDRASSEIAAQQGDSPLPSAPAAQTAEAVATTADAPSPANTHRAVIESLQDHVGQYDQLLGEFDGRLRGLLEAVDREEVASCLGSLRRANEQFLESRDRIYGSFTQPSWEQEFRAVGLRMEAALKTQSQQIATTNAAIDAFDYGGNLGEGCQQVACETSKLLEANDALHDALNEALVEAAIRGDGLEQLDASRRTDSLTGLSNRAGLESALAQWRQENPGNTKPLTAALVDIDEFSHINQQYGHQVGNRVLHAIAQVLTAETRGAAMAARCAGQRFFLLFGGLDVRSTTGIVERFRQVVERTRLEYGSQEVRVTVSCAVTEVGAEETPVAVYARAEATLQEAKRYGRNRTFLHEGKYPTPVVPPNLACEERTMSL